MEKLSKKQHIKNLKAGDEVNDIFSVKFKKPVQEYKNGYKFELGLADSTGEIMLKFWGDNNKEEIEKIYNSIHQKDIIYAKGIVGDYNKKLDISVNNPEFIRVCNKDEYDLSDFVLKTEKNIDLMFDELKNIINSIRDESLKKLLNLFFSDENFAKNFKTSPAAMYKHHGWIGGLLEHTLNVANICLKILEVHKEMNRDLIISGAILHDIGKIKEFEVSTNIKVSKFGLLKGHIAIGLELLAEKCKEAGISEENSLKLSHILLSHHGEMEFGSPKTPAFPEALAVHYADELDAKLHQMIQAKAGAKTDDEHIPVKDFGNVYIK